MRQAIRLGERGRLSAPPNPWVGCVLVKNGKIIGSGYHQHCGEAHAEEVAIRSAAQSIQGADLYVTLEPCCHYGHTPPCTELLIQHQIARVFISLRDPDSRVSGRGIARLKQAGIEVYVGIEEKLAKLSLQPYLYHRAFKKPWIILKTAATLDGQVADSEGQSQWITCPRARQHVGLLRAKSQAVLVGSNTVCMDNPALTARQANQKLFPRQPYRVILDSRGKVPLSAQVFVKPHHVIYATTTLCSQKKLQQLKDLGVDCLITDVGPRGVDVHALIQHLYAKNIMQVLVEGGRKIHTSFLQAKAVQSLAIYLGAKILGDQKKSMFEDLAILLPASLNVSIRDIKLFGETVYLSADIL